MVDHVQKPGAPGPVAIIYPRHNSHGKRDVTGAFYPEARRFSMLHGGETLASFDNNANKAHRRAEVEALIKHAAGGAEGRLHVVALFCHGYRSGMQTGHTVRHVEALAAVLAGCCVSDAVVPLMACSTAASRWRRAVGGDGGFADMLRDAMSARGMSGGWVDAHTTVAHTTKNPHVRRFYTDGLPGGQKGGDWIVAPRSPLWGAWRRALRETDLRIRFPIMTVEQIHRELREREA